MTRKMSVVLENKLEELSVLTQMLQVFPYTCNDILTVSLLSFMSMPKMKNPFTKKI